MAWTQTGSLKGPKGDTGAPGDRGPEGPAGPTGSTGATGPQGIQGPAGPAGPQGERGSDGADGKGITVAGSVANESALPTDLGPDDAGKGYITQDTGQLHVWTGNSFAPGVDFRGPVGPTGPQGPAGDRGATGSQGAAGSTGPTGPTGPQGPKGDTGPRGAMWFTGAGTPGTVDGSQVGDMYLDTASGTVYKLA